VKRTKGIDASRNCGSCGGEANTFLPAVEGKRKIKKRRAQPREKKIMKEKRPT